MSSKWVKIVSLIILFLMSLVWLAFLFLATGFLRGWTGEGAIQTTEALLILAGIILPILIWGVIQYKSKNRLIWILSVPIYAASLWNIAELIDIYYPNHPIATFFNIIENFLISISPF